MVLSLFKRAPLLDAATVEWLYDGFRWALTQFGSGYFYQKTVLVEPTDRFFPGKASDSQSMAELIFSQVKNYAGADAWPSQLIDHNYYAADPAQLPALPEVLENNSQNISERNRLIVLFEPRQVGNPEVMIANFSHLIAHHMGYLADETPPCDDDQWFHMAELIGVYLGFGLMLANTASPYRGGGCARCVSPLMERTGYLTEDEVTYALAIFSVLKDVPEKTVTQHLKRSLIPFYKRAVKEVAANEKVIQELKEIQSKNSVWTRV